VVIGLVDEPVVLGEGTYGWKPGLLRLYDQWCYGTGRPAVSQEKLAGEIAAQGVAQSYRVAALGLELRNFPGGGGEGLRLPYSFYLEHVVSVLLHVAVFILPAVWVLWLCLSFQFRHAKLGAYVAADDSKREHAWSPYDADIVKRYFDGHHGAAGGVVSTVLLAYLVVAWVVMVVDYVGDGVPAGMGVWCWARSPALPRPLRRLVKWAFVLCTLPFALMFAVFPDPGGDMGARIGDPRPERVPATHGGVCRARDDADERRQQSAGRGRRQGGVGPGYAAGAAERVPRDMVAGPPRRHGFF